MTTKQHRQEILPQGISLRELSRRVGVSASYLSQVAHGKRPASSKLLNMLNTVKGKAYLGGKGVQELGGSNPPSPTLSVLMVKGKHN